MNTKTQFQIVGPCNRFVP